LGKAYTYLRMEARPFKRKEPTSKRQRLLAELPVEEVNKSLQEQHDLSSDPDASVYLAAVMKFIAHKVLDLASARAEVPPEPESRRVITPESIRGAISSDTSLAHMVAELQRRNEEEDEGDEESDGEPSNFVAQPSITNTLTVHSDSSSVSSNLCATTGYPFSSRSDAETLTAIVLDPTMSPLPAIVWHSLTQNYSNPET